MHGAQSRKAGQKHQHLAVSHPVHRLPAGQNSRSARRLASSHRQLLQECGNGDVIKVFSGMPSAKQRHGAQCRRVLPGLQALQERRETCLHLTWREDAVGIAYRCSLCV